MYVQVDILKNGFDGRIDRAMDGCRWMDAVGSGWVDGLMEGWVDRLLSGWMNGYIG